MKRFTFTLSALAVAGIVAGSALASAHAPALFGSVMIQHELKGCHAWAVNGGTFGASKTLTLKAGGTVTFTNDDVMPQQLVKLSGGAVRFVGNKALNKPASRVRVTFSKPGRYVFGTKPGEDYTNGIKTIGEDNVLKLVVTVR